MDTKKIVDLFQGRKSKALSEKKFYAVLVPIIEVNSEPHLLFQVRSQTLNRQPGEISFPGGKIESGENPLQAALRETQEEMGIQKENIQIIGALDCLLNISNDLIYPFLGLLHKVQYENIRYSIDEVSEIFTVPIDFFIQNKPEVYDMSYKVDVDGAFPFHKIKNGETYQNRTMTEPVYFYEYDNYIIWGLTAKITRNFIKELIKKRGI
ncbi:MAG: CoA pyrophosphatase [Eubacteriaceae bacterium]|nr:CoA pyrophosphatase [Eubacteriaceae bacterium]